MKGTVAPSSSRFNVASTRDGDAPTSLLILWRTSVLTMMRPRLFHNSTRRAQLNPKAFPVGLDPGEESIQKRLEPALVLLSPTAIHQGRRSAALSVLQKLVLILHQSLQLGRERV